MIMGAIRGWTSGLVLGLGWDMSKKDTIDLDASVIVLNKKNEKLDQASFNHKTALSGAIVHHGDNRTGEGRGDDEEISIHLDRIPAEAQVLVFVINSFSKVPFTKIKTAYIRLREEQNVHHTLAFYRLSKMTNHIGLFFATLARYGPHWHFQTYATPVDGHYADASLSQISELLPKWQ